MTIPQAVPHSGGIPTICLCNHHVLEHVTRPVLGCEVCGCNRFVAKATFPWQDEEHALVPVVGRYEGNEQLELTKEVTTHV